MQTKKEGNIVFIRLFPDEDIHKKLKEACQIEDIKTAVILSGIGQLKNFRLGYFKEKNNYSPEFFKKPHELLSLNGNICKQNNEYLLHLHAVLGNDHKETIGGHLIEGKVEITTEMILLKTNINIKRILEEKTGLKGMFLE